MRAARDVGPACALAVAGMAAVLGAAAASFLLTERTPIFQSPYHHDDFDHLAMSLHAGGLPATRPVSRFVIAALAELGSEALYAFLLLLVVLYPLLCVVFAARLLEVRLSIRQLAVVTFLVSLATFLFEHSPETFRYTGHLTNALSTTLGMAAGIEILRAREVGSRAAAAAAAALFLLSAYAKEDLVVVVIALAAALWLEDVRRPSPRDSRRMAMLLASVTAIGASTVVCTASSSWAPRSRRVLACTRPTSDRCRSRSRSRATWAARGCRRSRVVFSCW